MSDDRQALIDTIDAAFTDPEAILDALLAVPVPLLRELSEQHDLLTLVLSDAVLTERIAAATKPCERCGGMGCKDGDRSKQPKGYCPDCHGSGSVAVDVLDLLVQAGLVEEVGHMKAHPLEILPTRPVFAAKDGTP